MDSAQNYRRSVTPITKILALSVLEEFHSLYKWENVRDNEKRTALDIGFGDGTVTTEVIKPFLPASTILDGADKSECMIRFAKHCYEQQGYKFFFLDVEGEILDKSLLNCYDHVFSFCVLHYVENLRQALQNMYDILKPNGNLILTFVPKFPFYVALKILSLDPKWSPFMQDVDTMCPRPLAEEKFPHRIIAEFMSECGFKNVVTKLDVKHIILENPEVSIKEQARFVDQFHKRMPPELQDEYLKAYVEALKQFEGFWTEKYNDDGEFEGVGGEKDSKLQTFITYEVLSAYGEKDSN